MLRELLRPHRALVLATALATAAAGVLGALPGQAAAAASAPAIAATSASITVTGTASGHTLPADFIGFSLGIDALSNGDFQSTAFADYLKALGPTGIIRLGGNSEDTTFWTSTGGTPPSWSTGTITPALLTEVDDAIAGTGWKVILGVNLKQVDASRAADEAKYAQQIFGSALDGIEIGNEPNLYGISFATYFSEFESYVTAIHQSAPGAGIVGPDADTGDPGWVTSFANDEAAAPDVSLVTFHYYPESDCGGGSTSIGTLLGTTADANETSVADTLVAGGVTDKVPAVMDETNSIVCGGQSGVSNVFASSLWSLDYSLLLAQQGVVGADYNGAISGCSLYSPLCLSGSTLTAQPLFYGFLAVKEVGTGAFLDVDNSDSANVRAYAVQNGTGLSVVLDDVQSPSSAGATDVTLTLPQSYGAAESTVLATSSSSGLSATSGITLGGQTISTTGVFPSPTYTSVPVSGDTVTVDVAPGSATILKLSGGTSTSAQIVGNSSGLCLSDTGGSTTLKTTADIYTCNGSAAQAWTVTSGGTVVDGNGLCLSVTGSSTALKTTADVYTCNGSVSENWTVESNGTIVNNNSGLCLSVTGASATPGATADIYTCNGSVSENWTVS